MALTRVSGNLLTSTAVTAGIYGGSGNTVSLTVDAQGRVTAAANVVSSGGGITYTTVKTANYTAVADDGVQTNTTAGAFTVTLPATPANGDQVFIVDSFNTWGTNNLTIGRNGSTIEGVAQDLVCDITGVSVQCVYNGTTWDIFTQAGGAGGNASQWTTTGNDIYYSTGNVGIKTTTFSSISGTVATLSLGGTNAATSGGVAYQTNGTVKGYHYVDSDNMTHQSISGGHLFLAVNTEKARINTYGLGLGGAIPSSGTGITFPATQSASSNANTLDDYEEGTFTPSLTGSSGGAGTYTARDGIYVKVGKMVTLNFWIYSDTKNTLSGNITLTGLPFASSTTASFSGYRPSPSLRTTALTSVTGFVGGWMSSGASSINLQIFNNGTATAELNATNLPTSLFEIGGSLSYITD